MRRLLPASLALALLLCVATARAEHELHGDLSMSGPAALPPAASWNEPLLPVLEQAAAEFRVPRDLLVVLGQLGSAFENRDGMPTVEGGYGVMALRQNILGGKSLDESAALLGVDAEQLKVDAALNIRGAAAVLDFYAQHEEVDRTATIDAWWPAVTRFAGLDIEASPYFGWQVFSRLADGWSVTNSRGETFAVKGQPVELVLEAYAPPDTIMLGGPAPAGLPSPQSPDYPPAAYDQAPACNYSTQTNTKDTVVIHTAEGSYAGTISWINNCASNVSAHYVVAEDGRITQMVLESQYAFHAGCYNARSIGLEHEGFAASPSHPTSMYNASGDLVRNICDDRGIIKQKRTTGPGIIGHVDVTNCCCGTHTDPGAGWNWSYYMSRVTGAPPQPAYAANFVNQSFPSSMVAGTTAIVWAEFRNDGTNSWTHCATKLGTSGPRDRSSPFCTPANWRCADGSNPGCHRPTDVDQSSVGSGQVGRFTFILTAPSTPGQYVEKFELVREGVTWFGPQISWTINVIAGTGNLTGTVRRASDGTAIVGASVTLSGVGSTLTNGSGVYDFNNVNAGNYTVSVSAAGFTPAGSGVTINNGATTTRDFNLTVTDTEPPSTPINLVVHSTTASSVSLSWTASTDNIGLAGYDIRRNGAIMGSSPTNSFTDMTAAAQTLYTYEVRARDAANNVSDWSDPVQAITLTAPTVVFSDGFNGGLGNWTVTGFAYSTGQNHAALAGAGAAYAPANTSTSMHHAFARPFAQAKVSGYFFDGKGGWKPTVCGWSYRNALSLRPIDGAAAMFIDNEFYNTPDNSKYYYRLIWNGGPNAHTIYATRDPNTDCNGAWIYFETIVSPGAVGSSPVATAGLKVSDRAGTTTTTQNLGNDFFSYGIGRVHLGLGISSANEGYWDDIRFEAVAPNVPVMAAPVAGVNQIEWVFSAADNNLFGYEVADSAGTILSPQYPAAGWLTRSATSWTQSGLTPNAQYARKVRAWNGTLNSLYSAVVSACTLSPPPTAGSVTAAPSEGCPGQEVLWTAVGGFGPGKVQYYRYVFDQAPAHSFDGTEPVWSAGTLSTTPSASGTWYLHVQGYNADDQPNGQFAFALPIPDGDTDGTADCQDGCPSDSEKSEPGVCGCGVPDIQQTSIQENGQPADSLVVLGGTGVFAVGASGVNLTYQWHSASGPLSDNTKYSGTTTDTLEIANVDNADIAAGPYHVVILGDCGLPVASDAANLVLAAPPVITAWRSVRAHAGAGDLAIGLNPAATGNGIDGPTLEARQGGVQAIEIDFDQEIALIDTEAVIVSGQTTVNGVLEPAVDYSALASVIVVDEDTLRIAFAPGALPDASCYTIKVAGAVENLAAQALTGTIQCVLRVLAGDVTGSGNVTLSDAMYAKAQISAGATAATAPQLDLDLSGGAIDQADVMAAKSSIASPAHKALCP